MNNKTHNEDGASLKAMSFMGAFCNAMASN